MSSRTGLRGLGWPIAKSLVFVVVTAFATTILALTITNGSIGGGATYHAIVSDATAVSGGDDVRMAGVRIGEIESVSIYHRREAEITFTVQSGVHLARTVSAVIRYRNLLGQRYLALDQGSGSTATAADYEPAGATIPITRTQPALDLTALFNGFQPLFQGLDPGQLNQLSSEIIDVFQGEGPTIDDLLAQVGSLTTTLAGKDKVIGEVIDNLNSVLSTVRTHGTQLRTLVSTLSDFVSGLAADRQPLGEAISGIDGLTNSVGSLLAGSRAPLKQSIDKLGTLSANLAGSSGALSSFLLRLPGKLTALGRTASYGSYLNVYECSISGRFPSVPGYYGGAGVNPVAQRCNG